MQSPRGDQLTDPRYHATFGSFVICLSSVIGWSRGRTPDILASPPIQSLLKLFPIWLRYWAWYVLAKNGVAQSALSEACRQLSEILSAMESGRADFPEKVSVVETTTWLLSEQHHSIVASTSAISAKAKATELSARP
jgi:hypothetical protein